MFENKVAVVTGGANGIGFATVKAFLNEGAFVIIADISEEHGLKAEKIFSQTFNNKCKFIKTDTSCENDIKKMCKDTEKYFGKISILINGAAKFIMKGIEATPEDWHNICMVNIAGYAMCAKYCVPQMKELGYGTIINICSISAEIAQPNFVTYSASKGAVASMTRCMALDLAKYNIRVNSISPATVWTDSNEKFHREVLNLNRQEADDNPEIGGMHILGRTANPNEIAECITFLASNKSSYITASNLIVDGGYLAK